MAHWSDTGENGESRQRQPPQRYWLTKGTSGYITVLDGSERDGPYLLKGRMVKAPPDSKQKYIEITCRTHGGERCPRDANESPRIVEVYSILKHYRNAEGKPSLFKMLLVANAEATKEYFRRQITKRHGLRGCMFEMVRSDAQRSTAVGDTYDFERKFSDDEMKERFGKILAPFLRHVSVEEYLKPYRYPEIFRIPTLEEIEAIGGRRGRGVMDEAKGKAGPPQDGPPEMDDVPF